MQALGFEMDYYDEYHNALYEVFDAVPNNVLYGIDGNLYFIDTPIKLREWHKKAPDLICQSGAFPYNMISNFSGWGYGLISFLYRPSAVNKYW